MSQAKRAALRIVPSQRTSAAAGLRVLCLSGPNLALLGSREPEIYGRETLADIHKRLKKRGAELGALVDAKQSDAEGDLVTWIGAAPKRYAGLLLNAAAYTHTSLAICDALRAAGLPCVEVHLSNPEAREAHRRESKIAPACIGKVSGFRGDSYLLALDGLVAHLRIAAPGA